MARMRPAYLPPLRRGRMLLQGPLDLRGLLRMQSPLRLGVPFPGSNGHVAENHPGCVLCWRCVTEAQECPICGLEGPLLEDDDFEREWAQAQ